jgi:hypothetical protein
MRRFRIVTAVLGVTLVSVPAAAHHEAIFGPQSSVVMGSPNYLTLQGFSRQTGTSDDRTQESTYLIGGGVSPFPSVPLSFALTLPVSHIVEIDRGSSTVGPEDAILGARYRLDITSLQKKFERDANYVMGMAAAEFPTGTVDHDAFHGPMDFMFAALGSVEIGQFSAVAYGMYRLHGSSGGNKAGDNLFAGAGLAYTPWDDPVTERLISFQLALSHETYFRNRAGGATVQDSGGWEMLVQPTVVWGPGSNLLVFATTGVPVVRRFRDPLQQDRWRVGAGITYLFR